MFSVAEIPFKVLNFKGFICVLKIDNKEYKFTTYNNAKLLECHADNNSLKITLKKDEYYLKINSIYSISQKLAAPVKGKMRKEIFESISATTKLTLKKNKEPIFSDISSNCGLEIVQ